MKRGLSLWLALLMVVTAMSSCSGVSPTAESAVPLPVITDTASSIPPTIAATLPPLPEFDQALTFGGAGGGGEANCDDPFAYTGPFPAVNGGLDFDSISTNNILYKNLPRLAFLCLWGFPADKPFEVSLTSPDGSKRLTGKFSLWDNPEGFKELVWSTQKATVYNVENKLATVISFWWPGNLQHGIWQVQVKWGNGEILGEFDAGSQNMPGVSLVDPNTEGQILPACHFVSSEKEFDVLGEDFPASVPVYVMLYEHRPPPGGEGNSRHYELVWDDSVSANNEGRFLIALSHKLQPGVSYQLIAVADPMLDISQQIENNKPIASDCFKTWDAPGVSSCPGAPAQRMVVNQRGYVCTQSEAVRLRTAPGRSESNVAMLEKSTQFIVLGGPVCLDNWSWWQVRTDSGQLGWLSEGGDETDPYFICPNP